MEIEQIKLNGDERLIDALKSRGYKDIPSNVILDKTLTGIGATYAELHSYRNSIIIEPNVPVIVGKAAKNSDWLAVYSNTTVAQIKKYLKRADVKYKKILTTPEGFKKVRKAADKSYSLIQETYFCLFDECEKLTQDCDYRASILQPVYDFFDFKEKAFVSATPLEVSHPAFEGQGFKKLEIVPQYDYRKDLHLIVTSSYERTVREEFQRLKDSSCVCIFLNSVTGINELVNSLHLEGESRIFCSEEGGGKLKDAGFTNAVSSIDYPLAKYNFFTSRFYSAVDIELNVKPDILILTNLNNAVYTTVDPYTEAIQIQGRFRRMFEDKQTFNSLTHITNTCDLGALSREELDKQIDEYKITYQSLIERHNKTTNSARKTSLKQQLKQICEDYLLDERLNIDYFGIDNKYNEERVKSYYQSGEKLYAAYEATKFFRVNYEERQEIIGEDDIFRIKKAPNEKERIRIFATKLIQLNEQCKENPSIDKQFFLKLLHDSCDFADLIIEAYEVIPFDLKKQAVWNCCNKKKLEIALRDQKNENKRFSPEVLRDIESSFRPYIGDNIAKEETKKMFTDIYSRHYILHNETGITAKVNQQTICEYFEATPQNKKKPNEWKIKCMLPQYAALVN